MDVKREWIEDQGPVTVGHLMAVYGSAEVSVMTNLRMLLLRWVESTEPPLLVLDLADTERFGAEFMNVMLCCNTRIQERGGRFALCNVNAMLFRMLQVARLNSLWPIYATRDEAIHAISRDLTS